MFKILYMELIYMELIYYIYCLFYYLPVDKKVKSVLGLQERLLQFTHFQALVVAEHFPKINPGAEGLILMYNTEGLTYRCLCSL